ncbi:hypothetical protein [Deinococcus sp. RM]|uniref:hypothetical protein n=1 Tax=Deinococcus sp. RM TaxID=2316359 RepID=UPI000E68C889|nr:hypothetical protein [Deinococcus sp. RM]RIY03993.1 hypothetical protein D3W47_12660 [Deinococcus sp. RM]
MSDTHTQTARAAQHAPLTPAERRAALARIEERRAQLTAELAQLDAIQTGHTRALEEATA